MRHYCANWNLIVESKVKLSIYKETKKKIFSETYCTLNLTRQQRSHIAKFRLGVLALNVEVGRYTKIPRENRLCVMCNMGHVENEIHVPFDCPMYQVMRESLFEKAIRHVVNFNEVDIYEKIKLLTPQQSLIRHVARFLIDIMHLRQQKLRK